MMDFESSNKSGNSVTIAGNDELTARFRALSNLTGNTPLLKIRLEYRGEKRILFAKSENYNLTGSIKDRMAFNVLLEAYQQNRIKPGYRIAEATSGNTGISLAAIGRALGHPVNIFMPDWMSRERMDLIRCFGATIVPVSAEQGGVQGCIRLAEELAANDETVFLPHQYANDANPNAHIKGTGPEIWWQLHDAGYQPDAFVTGVGTGGTVMGVGTFLRTMNPKIKIHPVEPAESPTLTLGHSICHHRIQGMALEFIPPNIKLDQLNEPVAVNDGDAILMAQKISHELGIGVGISSGANLVGALKIQNQLGKDAVVVTVFPDDNKKYLSTDLMHEEPLRPEYCSPDVRLLGFDSLKRL